MTSFEKIQEMGSTALQRFVPSRRFWLPSLGLRVSERKLLLFVVDTVLLNSSLLLSLAIFTDLWPGLQISGWQSKWFLTLTVVWFTVAAIFDVYNLARSASSTYSLRAITPAAALTSLIYVGIPWLTPILQHRSQAFAFILLAVVSIATWRLLYASLFVQPAFMHRALVVGAGNSGRTLVETLQSDYAQQHDANPFRGTGYVLLGFVDDAPDRQDSVIGGLPVLGSSQRLVKLVRQLQVDEVIVSITHANQIRPKLFDAILDCREMGVPVTSMTTVYERLTGRVAVDHASGNIEIAAGFQENPFSRFYAFIKRLVDLAGALVGIVVLAITAPMVLIANRLCSPGPLFFCQERVGYGGRTFTVIKFRSMVPEAEKELGATWASENDTRVTAFGRWLRRTHLDEVPQVINVLKGEMSIVGPRPERPEFVRHLSETIPFYRARHAVRPGITGWAQIHQDYGDSVERAREKVEYDLYYVKHVTPMLDLLIMLRTVSKVLGLRGR